MVLKFIFLLVLSFTMVNLAVPISHCLPVIPKAGKDPEKKGWGRGGVPFALPWPRSQNLVKKEHVNGFNICNKMVQTSSVNKWDSLYISHGKESHASCLMPSFYCKKDYIHCKLSPEKSYVNTVIQKETRSSLGRVASFYTLFLWGDTIVRRIRCLDMSLNIPQYKY